jgi:multisubunit Na+/H+ antiporter MnhG subunit
MENNHEAHEVSATKTRWVLIAFLGVAGFFLVTEHKAHVLGALPYLILLACPLLHMFMHRSHRHRGGHGPGHKKDQR